jgi:hypothetical protein
MPHMHRFIISLLAIGSLAAEPAFRLQADPATLASPAINEASGLAVSPTDPGFLWMVNDSGGTTEVHLSGTDGTARGSVKIADAKNTDWEDLAAFTLDGKPYLLIADTGDNGSSRKLCNLYVVREPTLPTEAKSLSGEIPIAWEISFTYEDGPRDCESVAVDAKAGKIILISKRTEPPGVYELPLRPGNDPIARKIGTTATDSSGFGLGIAFRNQPTGMDISADGSMAAIVTYVGVFLFKRGTEESLADALARKPKFLGLHSLAQAESVAFTADGKSIFAVSERRNSPVVRYDATE